MSVVVLRHFHVVLDVDVLDLNLSINTDEDPSLRIESSAMINLRGVFTKLNSPAAGERK